MATNSTDCEVVIMLITKPRSSGCIEVKTYKKEEEQVNVKYSYVDHEIKIIVNQFGAKKLFFLLFHPFIHSHLGDKIEKITELEDTRFAISCFRSS